MKRASFIMTGLTELRYMIPFSRVLHHVMPDVVQSFDVSRRSEKYNGFARHENFQVLLDRVSERCPWAEVRPFDASSVVDYAVSLEFPAERFSSNVKRVSIQHGFDCNWHHDDVSTLCDVYVCPTRWMIEHVRSRGSRLNLLHPPHPIPFWDGASRVDVDEKRILIFYPDVGDVASANAVITALKDDGFSVVVKQRRKHQAVSSSDCTVVWDDVWYPAEGIELALASRAVVGFGSTAYTDLIEAGCRYINIDLHPDKHPWSTFSHPEHDLYTRLLETDVDAIVGMCRGAHLNRVDVASENVHQFMIQLFT